MELDEACNMLSALVDAYADGEQSEAAGVVFAELDAARARVAELEDELAEMTEARDSALDLWRMSVRGVKTLADLPTRRADR